MAFLCLTQSPEAFTQTHIYFMALHEITKNTYTFGEVSDLAEIVLLLFSKQPTIRLDSKEPAAWCDHHAPSLLQSLHPLF